jgi:hypothetical protein
MLLLTLLACGTSGPCDGRFADDAATVTGLPAKYRGEASAQLLADDCALPAPVEDTLRSFASAPPDYRPILDAQLAAEDIETWTAACPGGAAVLAEVARTGDGSALWEGCELERLGWFTRTEVETMRLVVTPIVAAHLLQTQGAPELEARWTVRMLAGLSPQ